MFMHKYLCVFMVCCLIAGARAQNALQHPLEGYWRGLIPVGPAKLTLIVELHAQADGTIRGALHSLDQGALDLAIPDVTLQEGSVRFAVPMVSGNFEGKLENGKITGTWKQGAALPLVLEHVATVPELERPQEPKAPLPYSTEEIKVNGAAPDATLLATFTRPFGAGPFPAVLFIGNTIADARAGRDEKQFGHRSFLVLADALTRHGIATLRFEREHKSDIAGSYNESIGDINRVWQFLQARPDVKNIGLLGWGSGSHIASQAAVQQKAAAFLVLLSPMGLSGAEVMALQATAIAAKPEDAMPQIEFINDLNDIVLGETDSKTREQKLRERVRKFLLKGAGGAQLNAQQEQQIAGVVDMQLKVLLSPWFRDFVAFDAPGTFSKVLCPVLALSGENNKTAPATPNLKAIKEALQKGGNPDCIVQELPDLNHLLQTSKTGDFTEAVKTQETIAPSALQLIGDWIEKRAAPK